MSPLNDKDNMKVKTKYCIICKEKTLWIEDTVPDLESATVWHCMGCGTEERPDDYTDRGTTADYSPRKPRSPGGIELEIPVGV